MKNALLKIVLPCVLSIVAIIFAAFSCLTCKIIACVIGVVCAIVAAVFSYKQGKEIERLSDALTYTTEEDNAAPSTIEDNKDGSDSTV